MAAADGGIVDFIRETAARALTEKRGPEAQKALAAMQRAMTLQPLKEAEANALARQVTSALALGSYQTGTQSLAR